MAEGSPPQPCYPYCFMLDADISPEVARIARALGLDAVSVYECGRGELRDAEQLRRSAAAGRVFVTRNRNDFIRWTVEFAHKLEPHTGILIMPRSVAATRPDPLARALFQWADATTARLGGAPLSPYSIDFVTAIGGGGE